LAASMASQTFATHSTAPMKLPVDTEKGLASAKSQTIGRACRENVPSIFSPIECQRQTELQPFVARASTHAKVAWREDVYAPSAHSFSCCGRRSLRIRQNVTRASRCRGEKSCPQTFMPYNTTLKKPRKWLSSSFGTSAVIASDIDSFFASSMAVKSTAEGRRYSRPPPLSSWQTTASKRASSAPPKRSVNCVRTFSTLVVKPQRGQVAAPPLQVAGPTSLVFALKTIEWRIVLLSPSEESKRMPTLLVFLSVSHGDRMSGTSTPHPGPSQRIVRAHR